MRYLQILLAVAAVLCSGCSGKTEFDACGNFEADEILVSSQGTGQLMWSDIQEGMTVTAGNTLGIIDTVQLYLQKTQLESQLKSVMSSRPDVESQVASLRSQIANLKSEKSRLERLVAKGAAPTKQVDDIKAQIVILESQLDAQLSALSKNTSAVEFNANAISAQIDMIEDKISKCHIVSPVNGTVIAKYIHAGELVGMGTPIMKVADLENMFLRAYFTSDQLGSIVLGDKVTVTADFGGEQQFQYEGKIVWISSESEFTPKSIQTRNTRANLVYAVKIAVRNDGRLKIGTYGEVNINK
ncbi:MAG: HlyD family efflux transporter periplasmic adaptor subunit [Bacteroidales bacterium]|nr:HlyD family efflux transporter periplasmic adaptor subunit [Bacteroidales bacterium]